jgi:hypothetical protein
VFAVDHIAFPAYFASQRGCFVTEPRSEVRPPDGREEAQEASAGEPRESGPQATREAMASSEPFRLTEEELNERDELFTRPRKEQGPPLAGSDADAISPAEESVESVEETPVPEPPD